MTEFIALDTSIELSKWDSSINQMIADANRIEAALKFGTVNIRVDVDDAALIDAVGLVDKLNAQSANVRIDATVGTELQNAQDLITRIDSDKATVEIDATVDREFQSAAKLIERLDSEKASVTISATDNASTEIANVKEKLNELVGLAKLNLTLDAAGFLQTFNSLPIVSTMLDVETQTQRMIGSMERDLPQAGDIMNNVLTNNWGANREEIATNIIALAQLKDETGNFVVAAEDMSNVTQLAFGAAAVGGAEAAQVIEAASLLVKNGFVPNMEAGIGFIETGFRRGLNANEDFLDSVSEYSSTFGDLGISADGFLTSLKRGLIRVYSILMSLMIPSRNS